MPKFNIKAYYQNLARTFRNGPSVPHRIADKTASPGEYTGSPVGTALEFMSNTLNAYQRESSKYGAHARLARYGEYQNMETMAEIASALDIYGNEICSKGEYGEILKIKSEDPKIEKALTDLFYDTLNIEFNAYSWVRSLCKYGDFMLLLDHTPNHGIINAYPLPINEIEREEGFDGQHPGRFRYRWETHGNKILEPWQIAHFRLLGNDAFLPYGMSILESARRSWRQLVMMEDAVMVYRIVRSPERRVFYIDVGNIAPNDVDALIEQTKRKIKTTQLTDPTSNQVDLRYSSLSVEDDFFIPVRGTQNNTRIETLPGGQYVGAIEDLEYVQNKLLAALKIPKSYLGFSDESGGKSTLSQLDCHFARIIQQIQRVFLAEMEKVAMIQLYSMGFRDEDLLNFELSMANPSTINEIQRLELWRTRFEVASLATGQDGVLNKEFIYKHIFMLSDHDIENIEEGLRFDRLFQTQLDGIIQDAQDERENDRQEAEMGRENERAAMSSAQSTDPDPLNSDTPTVSPSGSSGSSGSNEGRDPNKQSAIPNSMLGSKGKKKKKSKNYDDLKNYVYNLKKNGMDPEKELQIYRRAATAPFGEETMNKHVKLLGKHTNFIEKLENMPTTKSNKKLIT